MMSAASYGPSSRAAASPCRSSTRLLTPAVSACSRPASIEGASRSMPTTRAIGYACAMAMLDQPSPHPTSAMRAGGSLRRRSSRSGTQQPLRAEQMGDGRPVEGRLPLPHVGPVRLPADAGPRAIGIDQRWGCPMAAVTIRASGAISEMLSGCASTAAWASGRLNRRSASTARMPPAACCSSHSARTARRFRCAQQARRASPAHRRRGCGTSRGGRRRYAGDLEAADGSGEDAFGQGVGGFGHRCLHVGCRSGAAPVRPVNSPAPSTLAHGRRYDVIHAHGRRGAPDDVRRLRVNRRSLGGWRSPAPRACCRR